MFGRQRHSAAATSASRAIGLANGWRGARYLRLAAEREFLDQRQRIAGPDYPHGRDRRVRAGGAGQCERLVGGGRCAGAGAGLRCDAGRTQ